MKFEIYKDKKGEYRWRLKARNGRITGTSGEGYKRRSTAFSAANSIIREITIYGFSVKVHEVK